jgi:mitogen-activated protein kinase organizer 1
MTMKGHGGAVHDSVFSSDGNYCMTCSADRTAKLWNPFTGLLIKSYAGHGKEVLGIALPKGENNRFATASGDRKVFVWDTTTSKTVQKFQSHTQRVNSVCFNNDGNIVLSGSYDSTIRIWDCRQSNRNCIQVLKDAKDSIESVSIVDYEIISGSVDGYTRIYDIRSRDVITDRVDGTKLLTRIHYQCEII